MARIIALQLSPHEEVMHEIYSVWKHIIGASAEQKYKFFLCTAAIYAVWLAPVLGGSCHALHHF